MSKIFIVFISLFLFITCYHPFLYEINTRPWLYELSLKYGKSITKLREIPLEEFDYLANNGVNMIWMMGVWKLGRYGLEFDRKGNYSQYLPDWTIEDVIGSPYAVYEYTCNPDIGDDKDLYWLKSQINSRGMKLMLDFVPNHSAVDAPQAASDPDMYIRAPEGVIDENRYTESGLAFGANQNHYTWKDVLQWNYFEKKTIEFMKNNILKIILLADAIRCDVAYQELNDLFELTWPDELKFYNYKKPEEEFWVYAIKEAKKINPEIIFLAESYQDSYNEILSNLGFDYTYNRNILKKLKLSTTNEFKEYIKDRDGSFWKDKANFVENHDELRVVYNMEGNYQKAMAAGTIGATIGGMIFMNHGQWEGKMNMLDVHLRRGYYEPVHTETQEHYKKLNKIIQDKAFRSHNYYYIGNMSGDKKDDFIAYIREEGDSHYLVVVNYSESQGCAKVPINKIKGFRYCLLYEMFNEKEYVSSINLVKNEGINICLKGWESQIFKYNYYN